MRSMIGLRNAWPANAEGVTQQGAQVRLDVWPNTPHDFQAVGEEQVLDGRDALQRIEQVIREYTG